MSPQMSRFRHSISPLPERNDSIDFWRCCVDSFTVSIVWKGRATETGADLFPDLSYFRSQVSSTKIRSIPNVYLIPIKLYHILCSERKKPITHSYFRRKQDCVFSQIAARIIACVTLQLLRPIYLRKWNQHFGLCVEIVVVLYYEVHQSV